MWLDMANKGIILRDLLSRLKKERQSKGLDGDMGERGMAWAGLHAEPNDSNRVRADWYFGGPSALNWM